MKIIMVTDQGRVFLYRDGSYYDICDKDKGYHIALNIVPLYNERDHDIVERVVSAFQVQSEKK